MRRSEVYNRVLFSSTGLQAILATFREAADAEEPEITVATVSHGDTSWAFDNLDEWLGEYARHPSDTYLALNCASGAFTFSTHPSGPFSDVGVGLPKRELIERVFNVVSQHVEAGRLPEPPPPPPAEKPRPKVAVGHGRSQQWRDLKDHLADLHNFDVQAYETGSRSGHTIRDILDQMLGSSNFAVLVMTGEDETAEGKIRARQNVIHEIGLFQGKLGFQRAVVLVERGVEEFSNLQGIHVEKFSKGNIKETFGSVVAAINREFPPG